MQAFVHANNGVANNRVSHVTDDAVAVCCMLCIRLVVVI